jgi:hypothetical protein
VILAGRETRERVLTSDGDGHVGTASQDRREVPAALLGRRQGCPGIANCNLPAPAIRRSPNQSAGAGKPKPQVGKGQTTSDGVRQAIGGDVLEKRLTGAARATTVIAPALGYT